MTKFRRARRYFGKAKKFYGRHKASINPMKAVLFGGLYGAIRSPIHNMTAQYTNMLPLGGYSDEIAYGLAGYFMAKNNNPIIKNAGMAILTVESASIGQQALSGLTGSSSSSGFNGY